MLCLHIGSLSFFVAFLHFFLVFSFGLNDEAEHLALCRSDLFLCSFERVHVPEAYVSVGVLTMLNKKNLCRSRYDFDVNSCLFLESDAHAALIRLLISVVSRCSKVIA